MIIPIRHFVERDFEAVIIVIFQSVYLIDVIQVKKLHGHQKYFQNLNRLHALYQIKIPFTRGNHVCLLASHIYELNKHQT